MACRNPENAISSILHFGRMTFITIIPQLDHTNKPPILLEDFKEYRDRQNKAKIAQ
jgi:hypothetical protein